MCVGVGVRVSTVTCIPLRMYADMQCKYVPDCKYVHLHVYNVEVVVIILVVMVLLAVVVIDVLINFQL